MNESESLKYAERNLVAKCITFRFIISEVVRIQRILILEKWILKIIKIDNMKKLRNIIKKYNKSFLFLNLKFYNLFVLSSNFNSI